MGKSESKVQKVAKGAAKISSLAPCISCGGEVQWAKWGRAMKKTCMKCGAIAMIVLAVVFYFRFEDKQIGPFRKSEQCEKERSELWKAMEAYGINVANRAVSRACWEAWE